MRLTKSRNKKTAYRWFESVVSTAGPRGFFAGPQNNLFFMTWRQITQNG